MTFEIETDGRIYAVNVERDVDQPGRFRVTVDGRHHEVDALQLSADTLSVIIGHDRRVSYEVGFLDGREPGEVTAHLHGLVVPISINGRRARAGGPVARGKGEQRLVAPMPGRVLRVLVGLGDEVAARQPLVVVEAMKMENELSCARPGRVKEVAVTAGMPVEAGRLLLTLE